MTKSTVDPDLVFRFFNEIGIISQLSGNYFQRVMPHGMTLPQFSVLNHLIRLGVTPTPVQLASAFQVTKGAMTNTLKHLDGKGFVTIKPDEKDGRSKRITISDSGRAAHADAVRSLQPDILRLAEFVSAEQMTDALPILEHVRKTIDENWR